MEITSHTTLGKYSIVVFAIIIFSLLSKINFFLISVFYIFKISHIPNKPYIAIMLSSFNFCPFFFVFLVFSIFYYHNRFFANFATYVIFIKYFNFQTVLHLPGYAFSYLSFLTFNHFHTYLVKTFILYSYVLPSPAYQMSLPKIY